jgi:hypothetical protein
MVGVAGFEPATRSSRTMCALMRKLLTAFFSASVESRAKARFHRQIMGAILQLKSEVIDFMVGGRESEPLTPSMSR